MGQHRAIGLIDLTNLDDDCNAEAVDALCRRAIEHHTAAVCVWPDFVAQAAAMLAGSGVRVATVVNFPSGRERAHAAGVLTARAVADGADEIDVVLPYTAFAAGDEARAGEMLRVVRVATASSALMKVILETGELVDDELIDRAARFAIDHQADFIKTSTGKTPTSATPEAVRVMLAAIADTDRSVGIKPSGGIRTADDADLYLDLAASMLGERWVSPERFRFGASGLLDALIAVSGDPESR